MGGKKKGVQFLTSIHKKQQGGGEEQCQSTLIPTWIRSTQSWGEQELQAQERGPLGDSGRKGSISYFKLGTRGWYRKREKAKEET